MTKVVLEPELEIQVVSLSAQQRRDLARVYFRWAKQLYRSADIIDPRPCGGCGRRERHPLGRPLPRSARHLVVTR